MIQKWYWTILYASDSLLREVDCSCTSEVSQITSAVLRLDIHMTPGISQSVFVIPVLVRWHSQVQPKFSPALRRDPKLITITPIILLYQLSEIPDTPVPVVRYPSYSEGLPEYSPKVWYSPEIDASKFTLHILSDTPGLFQRLTYILLMCWNPQFCFAVLLISITGVVGCFPPSWSCQFVKLHMLLAKSLHALPDCFGDCDHHPAGFVIFAQLAQY